METQPHAVLLKFPGTNCDAETARALEAVGFSTETLQISRATPESLDEAQLVVPAGGFSYGDYVMAGRLAQLEIERKMGDALHRCHDKGGYLLGICNGFQILTKIGLLPEGSLIHNTSGRFICRWAEMENHASDNAFLQGLPAKFELPVAHAEGRFVAPDGKADAYLADGLAALTYTEDFNGSSAGIAGLADKTGRVFGLMPHPERFLWKSHHYDPDWSENGEWGWGHQMFKSVYEVIAA